MKKKLVITLFILFMVTGIFFNNPNYQIQVVKVDAGSLVPLTPKPNETFLSASDVYQYVSTTQSVTYGTITTGPPSGMGQDDETYTTLQEEGYIDYTYTQLEYAGFGSSPSGWTLYNWAVNYGEAISTVTSGERLISTKGYDLSAYVGARLVCQTRASTYNEIETNDYYFKYSDDGGAHTIASVPACGVSWVDNDMNATSTYSNFKFYIDSGTADSNEQLATDNWYVYGITQYTYYRLEVVLRFDSVTTGLGSYGLYIDFHDALTGSDDLTFYIGSSTNPTHQVAINEQDDFNVDVSNYISDSTIYLKVIDDYRSGDTIETNATISRCYLFSSETGWYSGSWKYRQQININGSTGATSGFQILVPVTYNSHMQGTFDDLRFTDNDGTTLLSYWIENSTVSTSANVWVKVTDSLETDSSIFMYYGNNGASSLSSKINTMTFNDEFSGASLNTSLWDHCGDPDTYGVSSGIFSQLEDGGYHQGISTDATWSYADGYLVTAYIYADWPSSSYGTLWGLSLDDVANSDGSTYASAMNTGIVLRKNSDSTKNVVTLIDAAGTDHNGVDWTGSYRTVQIRVTASVTQIIYEGTTLATGAGSSDTTFHIQCLGNGVNTYYGYTDWVYMRRWLPSPPVIDSFGSEIEYDSDNPTIAATSYSPANPTTATGLTIFAIVYDDLEVANVWFEAIAYPDGFTDTTVYPSEVGTNTYTYTFEASDLPSGVYCFVAHSVDGWGKQSVADYTQYLMIYVTVAQIMCYIRVFDGLGDFVPFETFEIFVDGIRQYTDSFTSSDSIQHDVLVKDRWGEILNYTTFDAGTQELVVTVDIYSLKVQSWYDDYVYFNLTRSGITYTEVIAPLEIVNFRLYTNTYNWAVDYRNGTTVSGSTGLTQSTCIVITGSSIADVAAISATLLSMTTEINITVSATNNYVLTIQVDLTNINTTINNQLIQLLLNITNVNSTIYSQTIDLLAFMQNFNSSLFDQTVNILSNLTNINSTLYSQTVNLLSDLSNINSTLYSQTVSIISAISNLDSDIASQTVTLLSEIENVNSTIYSGILNIISDLSNVNSTIYSQTISVLSYAIDTNQAINLVLDPDIFHIQFADFSFSDDFVHFWGMTNWHNSTITIYENDIQIISPVSEISVPLLYDMSSLPNTYNVSAKFTSGSHDLWYNTSYTIAAVIAFKVSDWSMSLHLGTENFIEAYVKTTWENATIRAYDNGSLMVTVLESSGGTSFY